MKPTSSRPSASFAMPLAPSPSEHRVYILLRIVRNNESVTTWSPPGRDALGAADPPVAHQRQGLVSADGEQDRGAERHRHDGGEADGDPEQRHEQERDQ